jgi:hypothetical protein
MNKLIILTTFHNLYLTDGKGHLYGNAIHVINSQSGFKEEACVMALDPSYYFVEKLGILLFFRRKAKVKSYIGDDGKELIELDDNTYSDLYKLNLSTYV